jgi:hypothetical protein
MVLRRQHNPHQDGVFLQMLPIGIDLFQES